MSQSDNDFFGDYQRFAQQSQQAWQALWTQATAAPHGNLAAGVKADDDVDANVQRVLEGLKNYSTWLESLNAASSGTADGLPWADAMTKAFSGAGEPVFMQAFADFPKFAAGGPEQWLQQLMGASAPNQSGGRSWFELPTFGLNREQQETAQVQARSLMEYVHQSTRYQALLAGVGGTAAERLQQRLADSDDPGRQVDSLRALYDLWIDTAEEVYAEVAMSDGFREAYGAMVNAQMRVRSQMQDKVEQSSSELGMPTRSEVNSLGKRLHEMRRELKATSITALVAEVKALRREVETLRKSRAAPAKRAAAAPRKSAPKRSTATKKDMRKKAATAAPAKTTRKARARARSR